MLSNIVVAFKGQRLQLKLALGANLVDPDPSSVFLVKEVFIVVSGEILCDFKLFI